MSLGKETNRRKILIVFSHPKEESLNNGIKEAVITGLKKSNVEVKIQDLYKEKFTPLLYDKEENDKDQVIMQMKKNISWADWIVFIAPLWWANIPAMLKGYFDRVFTEDFAFKYNQAEMPEGLLENKKALVIATCDTPPLILRLSGGTMGLKSVIKGILKVSGLKDSTFKLFGSVLNSTEQKRTKWLEKAEKIGEKIGKPDNVLTIFKRNLASFIKAMRIRLYSFVFCCVLLGTAIGASITSSFSWLRFAVAALIGLLAHTAVSFSNEVADEPIDKINLNHTMFSGGTGLLAKNLITKNVLNLGWIISAVLALVIPIIMVFLFQHHWLLIICLALPLFLGIEYSLAPLRLSRRGVGEVAALIAYGVPLMLVGLIPQVDKPVVNQIITNYRFYMLALPVSLSNFLALCLTQIPDTDADKKIGKKSISVILGPKNVLILSAIASLICVVSFLSFLPMQILPRKYSLFASIMPLLTGVMILKNIDAYRVPAGRKMLNIMGMSVTSAILCAVVPAVYFFNNLGQGNLF